MGKENQRITITKRLLKEALLRLLEKKDLPKINITELCAEAGINRVTFYHHYETPHDVLLELEQDVLNDLYRCCPIPDTLSNLKQYLEDVCAYLDSHINILKLMVRNNTDQDFYLLLKDLLNEHWRGTALNGILSDLDPETLDILSIYNAGGGYFIMRQWLLGNIQKTPHQIAGIFYELLCSTDWVSISNYFATQ